MEKLTALFLKYGWEQPAKCPKMFHCFTDNGEHYTATLLESGLISFE